MTRLLKNSRKIKTNLKGKIFLGIVVLLLGLGFYFGKLSFLSESLQFIARPLWAIKNYSATIVDNTVALFESKEKLISENTELKNELKTINLQLLNKKLLLTENEKLKELLGKKDEKTKFILANVILKPNLSLYDSLILDVGRNYGIKKGAKILADANVALGEIVEVYANTSKAKIYSFPKDVINVTLGFNKILTQAEGRGSGNFEIKLPQGIAVAVGDLISLPEPDLAVLGVVKEIVADPEDPFQTILFKSPINIFELRWVQILQE